MVDPLKGYSSLLNNKRGLGEMNAIKPVFSFKWISKYRDELFGIAIIGIMAFHFSGDFQAAIKHGTIGMEPFILKSELILWYREAISSIGVEIFVFLSGMGLYYSYTKNSNLGEFYIKRYKRILPPYLIVAAIFWVIKDFKFQGEGWLDYLKDISFWTFVTDGVRSIWFIALRIVLYLIFPLIYYFIYKCKHRGCGVFSLILVTYAIPIVLYYTNPELYHNIEIALTRIPLFVLGCFAGKYIKNGAKIPASTAVIFVLAGIAAKYCRVTLDFEPYIDRYLDGLYALGLVIMLTGFLYAFEHCIRFNRVLRFFGRYSLELYMVHVTLRNIMKEFGFDAYRISEYSIMIMLAIVVSVLLNKLCGLLDRPTRIKLTGRTR